MTGTGTAVAGRPASVASAWIAGLVMLALATSVAGLLAAPVAVPAALVLAAGRGRPWSVRVPLLAGAFALTALVALWLLAGPGTGTTVDLG